MTPDEMAAAQAAAAKVREDTRQWRLTTPASYFANIKKQANDAGIQITAYTCGWGADYTDDEIDSIFNAAKALGASAINSSTTLAMAQRLAPFADKHQFIVAFHGHLVRVLRQHGRLRQHVRAIEIFPRQSGHRPLHGSLRRRGRVPEAESRQGHDAPRERLQDDGRPEHAVGTGDTPIKPVLQYLKSIKFPGVVEVEYDYPIPEGSNSIAEVKKCVQYMKDALA